MNEWIAASIQKSQEVLGLIIPWVLKIGGAAGVLWILIGKARPWLKGLWNTREKLNYLQNEQKNLSLREELILEKESNFKLKEENKELLNQLGIKENVILKGGILYYNDEEICSRCYDMSANSDRKTVRLLTSDHEIEGIFHCPECETHFKTKEGALQQMNKHREAVRQISMNRY